MTIPREETCACCHEWKSPDHGERCGWCGECPMMHSDEACAADFAKANDELIQRIEAQIAIDEGRAS